MTYRLYNTFSNPLLLVSDIMCSDPTVNNAERVSSGDGPYRCSDLVVFQCTPGYHLVGTGIIMQCKADTQWYQLTPGYCRLQCKYVLVFGLIKRKTCFDDDPKPRIVANEIQWISGENHWFQVIFTLFTLSQKKFHQCRTTEKTSIMFIFPKLKMHFVSADIALCLQMRSEINNFIDTCIDILFL